MVNMPIYTPRLGCACLLLILLISPLLLLDHAFRYLRQTAFPTARTQLSPVAGNGTSKFNESIAVSFGRQAHALFPFAPLHHYPRVKRALSQEHQCLVQKGQQYWEKGVLPAFDGAPPLPTPNFGKEEDVLQDSGWRSFEKSEPFLKWWKDAFKSMKGKTPKSNMSKILLDQTYDFQNDHGKQERTSAQYYAWYIPQKNAILLDVAYGPRFKVRLKPEPYKLIPRINQLSDLLWFTWTGVTSNPGSLRYYAVDNIVNPETKALMLEILKARRGTNEVPWKKRITFDLNSDEGQALLGSPVGITVNWLLIHHAEILGRREPRVTIWNEKRYYLGEHLCMIWDLIPAKEKGSSGKVEKEPKT